MCLTGFIRTSLPDQIWKYGGLEEKTDFILIMSGLIYGEDHKSVGNGILDCKSFFQACKLLADDYEQVRSAAVQLIWVLSQLYPERYVLCAK